ncbi:MAG: serine/threonine protein kinase [Alphaproteobacteria bacterium]|nr:serine/threonine protein kinase [Alphaproteobacteria bacterium]
MIGRRLAGRFEILRAIGKESLADVWAARDLQGGGLVRVKVMPATVDGEAFARFAREMKASFLVTHRNTVEVLEFGEEEGPEPLRWLATEWLVAHPLSDELAKGPIPWERASVLVAQVAAALGAAHQEGIVHRALSPECVLVLDNADGDYVKVRDFGLARLEEDDAQLTASGVRLGDVRYMPPEYVDTGAFGPKGDLYALGVLWFHLVAGRPPFDGDPEQLYDLHLTATPPRLSSVRPGVPAWVDELVAALLSKDAAQRPGVYRIVQRVEDELDPELPEPWPIDGEGRSAAPPAVVAESAGWTGWLVAGVALLLVGGVGLAGIVVGVVVLVAVVFGSMG